MISFKISKLIESQTQYLLCWNAILVFFHNIVQRFTNVNQNSTQSIKDYVILDGYQTT